MLRSAYNQTATYWGAPVSSGYGGHTYSTPLLLQVRWEDSPQMFTDGEGEEHVSRAVVYVLQDVEIGGYLALGDFTDEPIPTEIHAAMPIRQFIKIPDLRNIDHERRAFL